MSSPARPASERHEPERPEPSGAFFAPVHDERLWSDTAWITHFTVTETPQGYDARFVEVWLRPPRASEIAGIDRVPKPIPDRAPDMTFHNVGASPPLGFWHFHPRVEAFEIEHDEDDGSAWWARVWLKPEP